MVDKEPALILNRVSDAKQEDGYSLDAQEKYGREYCESQGFEIIKEFRFAETASKPGKRSKFDNVVKFVCQYCAKSKRPLNLVVEKTDRLARNYTSKEKLQLLVMAGRLRIHYYKDGKLMDENCSPADIFNDDIQTAVSKYTALNISRESKKGMKEKAEQGWFPGHAPMGYINIRDGREDKHGRKEARIIVDPDERIVKCVQRTFELRATTNLSYRAIAKKIRSEDILPFERARAFTKSSVESMLTNPFYDGWYNWREARCEGKHPVFIPEEHRRVVYGRAKGSFSARPRSVFSDFIKCGETACGCQVIYDPKLKLIKSTGEEKTYHYYHCTDGKQWHKDNSQKQKNISEEKLFEQFYGAVKDISITEEMSEAVSKSLKLSHERTIKRQRENMGDYMSAIVDCEKREDQLCDFLTEGALDKQSYQRQISRIRNKKREFETLLQRAQEQTTSAFYEIAQKVLELATNAELLWFSRSPQERVEYLKRILSNQVLDGSTVRYDLQKPFAVLAEMSESKDWCPRPDLNWHVQ